MTSRVLVPMLPVDPSTATPSPPSRERLAVSSGRPWGTGAEAGNGGGGVEAMRRTVAGWAGGCSES
jgi:hypothetical protein